MSRPRLISLLLALVTLVVFLPVTRQDFLQYDDDDYIGSNPIVQNGLTLAGTKWAFTTFRTKNWHPLTWLSHMADCQFFKLNAGAHHFVNVLFHAADAALLFILLLRLTEKIWPSALVAALFAWHPLHVESVAWISERKDMLSTGFALLALLSYVKFVKEKSRRSFWLALVFFALGLLAKPMLVTLPFVMLLLDLWPLQRFSGDSFRWSLVSEKAPFFLLTAASCVVTCVAQHAAIMPLENLPLGPRLENSVVATAHYLAKIFWPADLAIVYPFTKTPPATVVLSLAVLILVSVAVWRVRHRHPCWLVGWLWFLGTLVPVIGLVQVGGAAMADRYDYLPSIGIFIAVVFGLPETGGFMAGSRKYFPAAAVLLLVVCVAGLERQLYFWRTNEALFRHVLAITENNHVAHYNLGAALEQQGRYAGALAEYREALRLNPARHQVHFTIGNVLEKMDQPAEALVEYRECLRMDPQVPALHGAAGCALAAQGKLEEALKELAEATRLDPYYALPHIETAKIFFKQGRDHEAVDELHVALQAAPDDFQVLATAAHYLAASENTSIRDGLAALNLALKANDISEGSQPMVLDILAMAYAETGDFTNAIACAQNALELAEAAKLESTKTIRQRLELYNVHQPWRESFRGTNAPGNNQSGAQF
jgi:tetratricopeptide (TPR) repeat protein